MERVQVEYAINGDFVYLFFHNIRNSRGRSCSYPYALTCLTALQTTMFTNRLGTTMTFRTVFPSMYP
jgi:hypothetical protein